MIFTVKYIQIELSRDENIVSVKQADLKLIN
jgi:hypothetical protein